ncbi:phage tail protein [Scytonema hofmannii FACHB-248]|uniref:Phage tail protein n=1 Tax=Scytonema hofmannii FACHB-248 TaxID=1842502 RepID=A0ABR8GM02_9CYAN|nr:MULTISPECIES: phage tail protein [Nostocales]MBD2604440.1 phage tail protein [Scytonema hofmannii FACHB-248]
MVYTYPPVGFFFDVSFQGENLIQNVVETRFQSVTGLSVDMQTETLKEGGENRFEHILPVRTKYSPLMLKRGVVKNSQMVKWCMDAMLNFDIRPMNLLVNLLHIPPSGGNKPPQNPAPLITWKVINAWPKKWSVSEFNAEQNSIAIESLELNYSYFETLT